MVSELDPVLRKDLVDAKAALARHGVVIVRTVETELLPAIMAAARESMSASPRKLSKFEDDELDELVDDLRKVAAKAVDNLKGTYVRVLADVGGEDIRDVVKTLDGIDSLFKWERIAKAAEPASELLSQRGFDGITLPGPGYVSDSLDLELVEKWPVAFQRFKGLVHAAVEELAKEEVKPRGSDKSQKKTSRERGKRPRKR